MQRNEPRSQNTVGHEKAQQAILGDGLQVNLYTSQESDKNANVSAKPIRAWNLDPRNARFVGRFELFQAIDQSLGEGRATVIHALSGMGGVGKTQLALEYAHRNAERYDVAWWINSEKTELLEEQFLTLAVALGLIGSNVGPSIASTAVRTWLHDHDRWLLVFDNAVNPETLRPWLPSGSGHVLITSRNRRWRELACSIELNVLGREESVDLLLGHNPELNHAEAAELAAKLGDLPLALVQAAGFLEESGTSANEYITLLEDHAQELLDSGRSAAYPRSLAATIELSCNDLKVADPNALRLLRLCAFMAPEPIPAEVLTGNEGGARDTIVARRSLSRIIEYGLAKFGHAGLNMHRLTRTLIRGQLSTSEAEAVESQLHTMLAKSHPGKATDPTSWKIWALLIPHLLAVDNANTDNPPFREMIRDAGFYLISRGHTDLAEKWLSQLSIQWAERLGADHPDTLGANHILALAMRHQGRFADARRLNERTLAHRRRVLGENAAGTLSTANNLGKDLLALGLAEQARQILMDTLSRRRRTNGDEHLETLNAAHNLASSLHALGEHEAARQLNADILERRKRIFGLDHFHTLYSMDNLAKDLLALELFAEAVELFHQCFDGRKAVMGEDHPDTCESGSGLARALYFAGQQEEGKCLNDEILARRRRILGESHPDTLKSLHNLEGRQFRRSQ